MQRAAHQAKLDLLEAQGGNLLGLALALQSRLEEIESRVRVLQLVSLTIEALGDRAQPALGVIADALPQASSQQPVLPSRYAGQTQQFTNHCAHICACGALCAI